MIVITGLCDLVKAVVDMINDSSEVPNYRIMSPIVLLLSAVSVCVCVRAHACVCAYAHACVCFYVHVCISVSVCVCTPVHLYLTIGTDDSSDNK